MTQVPLWFDRKFEFSFPIEQYPNLCVRLRGTPVRLEEMVRNVPPNVLTFKSNGKWSAQEHAGHLLDLEALWIARVEDFWSDKETLSDADLTNRKTDEANHNAKPIGEILSNFRTARMELLKRLDQSTEKFSKTKLHPRLKQTMRLVDHLYFIAEHDDHHLAKIWSMIQE